MSKTHDIELRKGVTEELEWDPSVDARTIGVAIENGIVALTGHVSNYAAKTSAEQIVKRVHGVAAVANDIEVKLPTSAERDDVDIAASAVNALEWNVAVPKNKIKAVVTKGWVTLDGEVDWHYQKTRRRGCRPLPFGSSRSFEQREGGYQRRSCRGREGKDRSRPKTER